MSTVTNAIASPAFVKAIIVFLLLECAAIVAYRMYRGQQDWYSHLPTHAAGLCLLLAVHAALTGAEPLAIVVALSGAFVAHALDVKRQLLSSNSANNSESAPQTW